MGGGRPPSSGEEDIPIEDDDGYDSEVTWGADGGEDVGALSRHEARVARSQLGAARAIADQGRRGERQRKTSVV